MKFRHKKQRSGKNIFHQLLLWIGLLFAMCGRNIHRLSTIVVKNFKVLIRSKSSALVIILGPLLIIGLVGVAFNTTTVQDVHIGAYSDSYSELSTSLVENLKDESYSVDKTVTREECVEGVKNGDYNLCLVFSPEMKAASENNKISFYVDYTRVNLVYAVMDNIGQKVSESSNELSVEMTQILIDELENTKSVIAGKLSTLTAVSTNTEAMESQVSGAKDGLEVDNITMSASDLGFTNMYEDFEELLEYLDDENITSSRIENLNESMDTFEGKLKTYLQDTESATEAMQTASDTLSGIYPTINSNKKKINQVKAALEGVSNGLESIEVTDSGNIVSPISTDVQPVVTEETFLTKMFPTFLVLVILFVSIMLGSTLVLNEKNANAHFRNFVTPTSDSIFIIGTYITSLLMLIFQMIIVLGVSAIFLSKDMLSNFLPALYPLFIIATIFIFMGMCIGYLFNSNETANLASLFVVSASLFFSNTILPIETIPGYLKEIVMLNPFVLAEGILKKIILFGFGIGDVLNMTWMLWGLAILFIILSFAFMKIYKVRIR